MAKNDCIFSVNLHLLILSQTGESMFTIHFILELLIISMFLLQREIVIVPRTRPTQDQVADVQAIMIETVEAEAAVEVVEVVDKARPDQEE